MKVIVLGTIVNIIDETFKRTQKPIHYCKLDLWLMSFRNWIFFNGFYID